MTWNNLDIEKKAITIDKAYMRIRKTEFVNGEMKTKRVNDFKDLKSSSSYRIIGLANKYVEILKQHKEEQKELAKRNGKEFKETDFIFTTKKYNGYLADYTEDKFRKVMNTLKVKNYKELTVHSLRHIYCSMGIMNGTKLKEMQLILGHSDISVTANWYTHLTKEKVVEAIKNVIKDMEKCNKRYGKM